MADFSGVNNINRIVSILIGWGCDFCILLDNDQQGRSEYLVLKDKLCIPLEKICFTDGTNIYNTRVNHEIENIFSKNDFVKLNSISLTKSSLNTIPKILQFIFVKK